MLEFGEGDKTVVILIVKDHIPLAAMQLLSLEMLKLPLSKFVDGDVVISGVHVDFREDADDFVGVIEVILLPAGMEVEAVVVVLGGIGEEKEQSNCSDGEKEYEFYGH